jgi:hypothetical protein
MTLELQVKDSEIQNLKGGSGNQEKAKLEEKIKDLESRLAEYEIISEDIADLSRYKDENVKLKKEIEMLKSNGGVVSSSVVEDNVADALSDSSAESLIESMLEEAPKLEMAAEAPLDEKLSDSTAKEDPPIKVEDKKTAEISETSSEEVISSIQNNTEPVIEAAPTSAPEVAASAFEIDDDIMAEFAKAVEEQKDKSEDIPTDVSNVEIKEPSTLSNEIEDGDLDIDKMLSEADELPKEDGIGSFESSLDGSLDEEKLIAEADKMKENLNQDKKEEPVSEEVALMNEFEKFTKS